MTGSFKFKYQVKSIELYWTTTRNEKLGFLTGPLVAKCNKRMKKCFRYILLTALFALAVLSAYSAISPKGPTQDFSFQNSPACDLSVSSARIQSGFSNFAHFKGFFFMSLIALFAFKRRKAFNAFLFVFVLTFTTECLQMWSLSRHCRLTDAIPNFMGLTLAIGIFWLISKAKSKFQSE